MRDWVFGLVVSALVFCAFAPLGFRLGLLGVRPALLGLALGAVLSAIAILLGIIAFYQARKSANPFARRDWISLAAALVIVLMFSSAMREGDKYPVINDVTTDMVNVPEFNAAPELRGASDNPLTIDSARMEIQRTAYPEIKPLMLELSADAVFMRVVEVAQGMGWEIVAQNQTARVLEAVDRSRLFGFKDDVIIRVQREGNQTRVDMRSASRLGRSDLGVNAKRIKAFSDAMMKN